MSRLTNAPSATKWVLGGMVFKQSMRLLSNLLMTRVLSVEAFGVMAIVNISIQALNMMSDVGITQSVIRSSRTDDEFLRTAWTLQVIRGVFLWVLTCILAWPISELYNEPILKYILPCSGLIPLFVGLKSIAFLQNQRELKYKKIVIIETIAALVGLVAMVMHGLYYKSVWALVIGGLLSTFIGVVLGYIFLHKIKHVFCWNKEVVQELFHFGKWVFISSGLTFFVSQYDKLALGKLADMHALGLYAIAMVWALLPAMVIGQLSNKVFFPVVSELYRNNDLAEIKAIRKSLVKLSAIICLSMLSIGQVLINVLYEIEYKEAGDLVSVLAILALFQIIEEINTHLLLSAGRPKDKIISQIIGLVVLVLFLPVAFSKFGMIGVAFLAAFSMMIRAYILDLQLRKDKLNFFMFDLKITFFLLLTGFLSHIWLESVINNFSGAILLTGSVLITLVILVMVYLKQPSLRRLMNV